MRLLIDEKDLALLLEKKRDFVGNKVTADTIIAGISFLLSVFTASYEDILGIPGVVLKLFLFYRDYLLFRNYARHLIQNKNKYNHEVLFQDIEHLNMIQHNHSLVVIKDAASNRYLVYYDERWDCKLFLNYKTQDRNNESALKEQVAADLGLDSTNLLFDYIASRVQENILSATAK